MSYKMGNLKFEDYLEGKEANQFNSQSDISGFDIKQSEKRFSEALNKNFDKFIMKWIKKNIYDRSIDAFRYLDNIQKSDLYIEFIMKNKIEVETDDYIEYTYLKLIDHLDKFFTSECYLLTDVPYRFYKFKY